MTDEIVDVDESWDGKGSLDEHRKREFGKLGHRGFSAVPEPVAELEVEATPEPEPVAEVPGDESE